ncbi:hypothetical protein ElyMa_004126100 [Elysia marginata]|uniref:Uncharacterized protein n=1 Tax=Elysia marginata TaxID=1093978 RepID=A0AAV4GE09_9GAST|nr:hypothetical protein ElyMa_004126100 [Elysia marginata]
MVQKPIARQESKRVGPQGTRHADRRMKFPLHDLLSCAPGRVLGNTDRCRSSRSPFHPRRRLLKGTGRHGTEQQYIESRLLNARSHAKAQRGLGPVREKPFATGGRFRADSVSQLQTLGGPSETWPLVGECSTLIASESCQFSY